MMNADEWAQQQTLGRQQVQNINTKLGECAKRDFREGSINDEIYQLGQVIENLHKQNAELESTLAPILHSDVTTKQDEKPTPEFPHCDIASRLKNLRIALADGVLKLNNITRRVGID